MEPTGVVDIFATKGIEYIFVLGYLAMFIPFMMVHLKTAGTGLKAAAQKAIRKAGEWFTVPEGVSFHPGHAWAVADGDQTIRVGLDEFGHRLIGEPKAYRLPKVGTEVTAGVPALQLDFESAVLDVLSPVQGEVVEVNERTAESPGRINADPFGEGWLMKVRVADAQTALRNLLDGSLAHAWMKDTTQKLRASMGDGLGEVMADGGEPINGMAREIAPEDWPKLARKFLLTERD